MCKPMKPEKFYENYRNAWVILEPVLDAIGQLLVSSTQLRFVDQEDPEHVPWEPLSQATLDRRRKKGVGAQILRDTGRLASSISYTVSPGSVLLGTDVKYAGIQQFGTKRITRKTKRGTPIPWGDIPPRPFSDITMKIKRLFWNCCSVISTCLSLNLGGRGCWWHPAVVLKRAKMADIERVVYEALLRGGAPAGTLHKNRG